MGSMGKLVVEIEIHLGVSAGRLFEPASDWVATSMPQM